jgi:hypothetical protein
MTEPAAEPEQERTNDRSLIDDLERLTAAELGELRSRLMGAGLSSGAAAPILAAGAEVPPLLARPPRLHALRALGGPAATAMRMWMFSDPVSEADARALLGPLLDRLVEAGVVVARGGGLVSRLVLALLDELFVLSDDVAAAAGGYGAMGFATSTVELCRAAFSPRHRAGWRSISAAGPAPSPWCSRPWPSVWSRPTSSRAPWW